MKKNAKIVEVLTAEQLEDLRLELQSQPLPMAIEPPTGGWLGEQTSRRRRLIREYEVACDGLDDMFVQARRIENHAARTLQAKVLADAKSYSKKGLLGDDEDNSDN
jgi:hypothetical protein